MDISKHIPHEKIHTDVESSVIIPVFNQWELTRACLKALAATTKGKSIEVIVVDNASTDVTPEACPFLGKQLFGDKFRYFRCSSNMNFGPASNIGANMATGKYLVFLNNDTVPLEGWYQPLIDDFSRFPKIAATGPLLVYPKSEPFGYTVQHLGVFVSPFLKMGHLYEGIPAESPLAKKRRFFQIITAACMVIPRELFLSAGLFDEKFINGFEDVDLCLRLWKQGYRMTVNPEARVIHHRSQTPGRHQYEQENSRHLVQKCQGLFIPDWHIHLKNDGIFLKVSEWQTFQPFLPHEQLKRLDAIAANASYSDLTALLIRYPFWENGWRRLIKLCPTDAARKKLQITFYKFYSGGDKALDFYDMALKTQDKKDASGWLNSAIAYCKSLDEYAALALDSSAWCIDIGLADIAEQYHICFKNSERFNIEKLQPFLQRLWHILVQDHIPLFPFDDWAYTAWRYYIDLPRREVEAAKAVVDGNTAFSILMPVYNPRAEHLTAALDSVLAQDYPHWELCIADDASTDAEVTSILTHYSEKDTRIRIVRREENGHIAAATNTALEIARTPWTVLMDQDDLLTPDALRLVAEAIAKHPDGILFYSDEDKIDDTGRIFHPHLKNSKWDWELILGQNFVCHLAVYRTERLRTLGGLRQNFPSAQDHDLILRYVSGLENSQLIHIPYVLYRWRAHEGSTARSVRVKAEALSSARRAVQDYLDTASPGAVAHTLPDLLWGRVVYPLPDKRPLVSLVCDMDQALPLLKAQLAALYTKTAYSKYEILVLYSDTCPPADIANAQRIVSETRHVRFLSMPADFSQAQRLEKARQHAQGQVLGFLSAGLVPVSDDWLEEMVSCLCRDGIGACGGKVSCQDGTMAHGGYLIDAYGQLKALYHKIFAHQNIWFGWDILARTVDALDGLCFFTKREALEQAGGFDTSLPNSSIQDYCLRLAIHGLRTVWWPHARFVLASEKASRAVSEIRLEPVFQERWAGKLTPCNENLIIENGRWSLCINS